MALRNIIVALLAGVLSVAISMAFDGNSFRCLGSGTDAFDRTQHSECKADKIGLTNKKIIIDAQRFFGIPAGEVSFVGCDAAPFQTRPLVTDSSPNFEILYCSKGGDDTGTLAAPILHELGHVYQLRMAGSYENLRRS